MIYILIYIYIYIYIYYIYILIFVYIYIYIYKNLLYIYIFIFLSEHMVSKNFELFSVVLMSSILTSNLLMSQAKKALHFLTLKLVLKTVRLLQICM